MRVNNRFLNTNSGIDMSDAIITLRNLEVGDIFYNIKEKSRLFVVRGDPFFNSGYGSATRICLNMKDGTLVSKACKINVIKVGVSRFADKYKSTPINKSI